MPSFNSDTALAWQNGQFLLADKAAVALDDAGFVMGATVSEQLRTFAGKLFCLPEHLTRLARSLELVGIELPMPVEELGCVATQLAEHNYRPLPTGQFVVPPSCGEVASE
jgi:branched-subunit amino acid aminotransferase/4-amino-4-deoxychorismate lyase